MFEESSPECEIEMVPSDSPKKPNFKVETTILTDTLNFYFKKPRNHQWKDYFKPKVTKHIALKNTQPVVKVVPKIEEPVEKIKPAEGWSLVTKYDTLMWSIIYYLMEPAPLVEGHYLKMTEGQQGEWKDTLR
jgi:hypothetical protein